MEIKNSNVMTESDCRLVSVDKRVAEVVRGSVEYDLYRFTGDGWASGYIIGVRGLGEGKLAFIGTDEEKARAVFEAVVSGGVTACTLSDVIADMTGE
jgi:hypothetical protein